MLVPPEFRSARQGYDPADVDAHVAWARQAAATLQEHIRRAHSQLATLRAELSRLDPPDDLDGELVEVIQAGERRGDEILAEAKRRAARVRADAERRIAELRDDGPRRQLEARAGALQVEVEQLEAACEAAAADLETTAAEVDRARWQIVDGLDGVLHELAGLGPNSQEWG